MSSSEEPDSASPSDSPTPPESAVSPSSGDPNQNSEVVSSEQASNDFNELFVLIESFIGILDPRTICEVAYEYAESITPPDADFSDFKANYMSAVMLPLMLFSFIAACSHSEMFEVMSSKQIEEIKKGGRKRQSGGGKNGQPSFGGPFRGPPSREYMNHLRKLGKDHRTKRNGRDVSSFDPEVQFYTGKNFPPVSGYDEEEKEEEKEEESVGEGHVDVAQVEQGSQPTLHTAARIIGNKRFKTRTIRSPKLDTKKWLAWTFIFMICFAPIAGAKTQQDLPGKYHKIPLRNPELDIARQMIANSAAGSFIANAGGALHLTTNTLIHAIGSNSQAAYALNYVQQLPAGKTIASTLAPLVGATKITPQTNLPVNVVLNRNPAVIETGVTVANAKSGADNIPVQYISDIEQQAIRLAKLNSFCGQRKGEINVDRTKCNSEYFKSVHQRLYLAFSSFPGLVREQYDQYMASSQKSCGADMKVTRKVFVPEVPAVAAGTLYGAAVPAKPAHYIEETVPCIDVPRHLFHVRNDPNDGAIEFYIPEDITLDAVRIQLRDTMPKECPRVEYSIINGNQKDFDLNIEKWVVDFVTNKELRKTIDLIKDPELKKSTLKDLFNKCLIWQLTLDVTSDEYFQLVKELSASVDIDIQLPSDVPKALIVENSPVALYMAQYKSFEYLKIMSQAELAQQEKDNARIKEDRGKDNYVDPPVVERLTVDKIMKIYEEYKRSETYAARFAAGVLGPTLRGIGEILEKTLDEASRAAARSAGKIVKNVGEELGMGNLFGGLAIFGFWSTLAGVGVPAAGIFGSFGYVAWWVFMKTMGKNRARISAGAGAGGCIRRNARSGGGGTKKKKIKTKIVKSKKRRLIYFTRRRSIIKKIRRSNKK
jgi:hypothetical protein